MLMREEVQLWSLARVEAELACTKAWLCQHLHFDHDLGLWSEMTHNMEILERKIIMPGWSTRQDEVNDDLFLSMAP